MISNSDILADKEAQVDALLREGTVEEIRDFIYQIRLLAWELNDLTYKLLSINSKPYHPKHFR